MTVKAQATAMNFQDAFDLTVKALEEAKADGAEQPLILAALRAKMYDEELFSKADRQLLLRDINRHFETNYTMNNVRKANVALLHEAVGKKTHKEPSLIQVDELHGSVDVSVKGVHAKAIPDDELPSDNTPSNAEAVVEPALLEAIGQAMSQFDQCASTLNKPFLSFFREIFEKGFVNLPEEVRHRIYTDWAEQYGDDTFTALSDDWRKNPAISTDDHFFSVLHDQTEEAWESFKQFGLKEIIQYTQQPDDNTPSQTPPTEPVLEQPTMADDTNTGTTRDALQTLQDIRLKSREADKQCNTDVTNTTSHTPSNEKVTDMKKELNTFITGLEVFGYKDEAGRQKILQEFIKIHPQFQLALAEQPAGLRLEEGFFNSCAANAEMEQTFTLWMVAKHPDVATQIGSSLVDTASGKSRFSIMGGRDEGVRSSWVAAGSAIVGGLLEMSTAGNVSVGAAVGTLVGAAGSFALAEQTDKLIENQFGRYVAGGTLGLAVGALASKAGRYAEGALRGSVPALENETPVLQLPASVVLRTNPAPEAALRALVAGL